MATTQYIGARYVPLFADPAEWNSTRTYEPLTIVMNEGNSYTSKQYVPKGIDISNEDFWALTGNYNAQVEQYRKDVIREQTRAKAAEQKLTADLATEQTRAEAAEQKLTADLATKAVVYNNVAEMKSDSNLTVGDVCHTSGYHSSGDNGGAWYVISDNGDANEMDVISCGSLFAHLIYTNNAITPEMLGAYGDGLNVDSSIFERILELSVSNIVNTVNCKPNATYNLGSKDILNSDFYKNLTVNGNRCTFKNGTFVFNLKDKKSTTWNHSYPNATIYFLNCIFSNPDYAQPAFSSGTPVVFLFCSFYYCKGAIAYPTVYMDVNIFNGCTFAYSKSKYINVATSDFDSPSLCYGDMHVLENCHSYEQIYIENNSLFFVCRSNNTLRLQNCINIGVYSVYQGNVEIDSCHFESTPLVRTTKSNTQSIHFNKCVFQASIENTFVSSVNVRYDNCSWLVNARVLFKGDSQSNFYNIYGNNNAIMYTDEVGDYATNDITYKAYEGSRKRYMTQEYSWNLITYCGTNNRINGSHEFPEIGDYTYNVYLSIFKDTIVGAQYTTFNVSKSISSTTSNVNFQVSKTVHDMWLHFYRTLPSGKIQKAIIQFGNGSNIIKDLGVTLASVLWVDVDSLPTPAYSGYAALLENVVVTNNDYTDSVHAGIICVNRTSKAITALSPATASISDF